MRIHVRALLHISHNPHTRHLHRERAETEDDRNTS